MRKYEVLFTLITLVLASVVVAQIIGDQETAGFNDMRTYLNSDAGAIMPPLTLQKTILLPPIGSADSMSVFGGNVLVASSGAPGAYTLLDTETGAQIWNHPLSGALPMLDYQPAFTNDIVLLGDPATTKVYGVRVSTGQTLWTNSDVGNPLGRYPSLTARRAIFHGASALFAAHPTTGEIFWQRSNTTGSVPLPAAQAPLAISSGQVFVIDSTGTLHSFDICSGELLWSRPNTGGNGSHLIASEQYVFVTNPANRLVQALNAYNGGLIWSLIPGDDPTPGLVLAYGNLYVLTTSDNQTIVSCYVAKNGVRKWTTIDASDVPGTLNFGLAANNLIYFYNTGSRRIRIIDAFAGSTRWSVFQPGVRTLSVVDGMLFVLLQDRVQIYEPSHTIFLPQIVDGGGGSTLITLVNVGASVALATVEFFDDNGIPLALEVEGQAFPSDRIDLRIPLSGSGRIQTMGALPDPTSGWARVTSDQPLSGSSIFQYGAGGQVFFEAGVASAVPTGLARVFVTRVSGSPENPFSTGIALANPMEETANIQLQYRRRFPTLGVASTTLRLGPLQHTAQFIEELFPGGLTEFGSEGTLIMYSDLPVVVSAVRTRGGVQMSSYPVAQ